MTKFVIDNGKNLFESYDKPEIDEKIGSFVSGTLTAGQTMLVLSDSSITTNSTFDFYTSVFGVNPIGANVQAGQITLTFDAQAQDVGVKIRVNN